VPGEPRLNLKRIHLIGLAVFLAAFLLRLPGLGWALPGPNQNWSLHPDEPVVQLAAGSLNPAQGRFTPGFYNYGTLGLLAFHVADRVGAAYGPDSESDRAGHLAARLLAGRAASALAGASLVLGLWLFLRRRIGEWGAGAGALAALFSPGLLTHSRFMTVDVMAAALCLSALIWSVKAMESEAGQPLLRAAMIAGGLAGLAAGVKYNMVLALVALFVGLAMKRPDGWIKAALAGLGTSAAAFLIAVPGVLLETAAFLRDFQYELLHTSSGHGLVFTGTSPGFIYHVFNLFAAMGLLLSLMGLGGAGAAIARREGWMIAWAAFGLAYFILIGRAEVKFLRYVFPLIPVLAAGFGWLAAWARSRPRGDLRGRITTAASILALGGWPLGGAAHSLVQTTWMASADPRQEAADWLRKEGRGRAVGLVVDPWFSAPTLYPDSAMPRFMAIQHQWARMEEAADPRAIRWRPENPDERFDWDVRLLGEEPDFIAFSSFDSYDLERLKEAPGLDGQTQVQVDRYKAFRAELKESYEIAAAFGQDGPVIHDLMYIRPQVWIWRRKADSSPASNAISTGSSSSEGPPTAP
jgi:hypothetical protein